MLPRQSPLPNPPPDSRPNARPNARQRLASPAGLPEFTPRQRAAIAQALERLAQASEWHGALPVMLLDRCWLRLRAIPVEQLAQVLPPDTSADAPELVQFRQLVQGGESAWAAEQQCWHDFGPAAWHQALHRFWSEQERGNHDWTLQRYLDLLERYRQPFQTGEPRHLPLVVLARQEENEAHGVYWIHPSGLSMRHTCL